MTESGPAWVAVPTSEDIATIARVTGQLYKKHDGHILKNIIVQLQGPVESTPLLATWCATCKVPVSATMMEMAMADILRMIDLPHEKIQELGF